MRGNRTGGKRREEGFTLLEVVVAIAILGIIIVPLTTSLIEALRNTKDVADRILDSADAQRIGDAWTQDVQSLDKDGPDVHGYCSGARTSGGVSNRGGTQLISFYSDVASNSGQPQTTVTWVVREAADNRNMQLYRRICKAGIPVKEELLASGIGLKPDSDPLDMIHGPSGGKTANGGGTGAGSGEDIANNFCDGDSCTIVIDGSFKYQLEVARRDPGTVTNVQLPPAPVCVSATPGNQLLSVVWSEPATAVPITGFHIEAWVGTSGTTIAASDETGPTSTAINLTGLSNAQDYYVAIYAFNDNGFSSASNLCGPVRPSPTIPGIIDSLVLTPGPVGSPLQFSATWTGPVDTGGVSIDKYEIQAVDASGANQGVWPQPTAQSGTVTGLQPDTKYFGRVRAHNSVGWGPLSDPVEVHTRPPAPTVTSVLAGNGKALVNFTVANNGDVPLMSPGVRVTAICVTISVACPGNIQYVVNHPNPGNPNGTWQVDTSTDTTSSPAPAQLVNGQTYQFRVELRNVDGIDTSQNPAVPKPASNGDGWGPQSAVSSNATATPVGPPTAPYRVSIQPWSTDRIILFQIAPPASSGGSPVTGYKIKSVATGLFSPFIPIGQDDQGNTLPYTQLGWVSADGPASDVASGNYAVTPGVNFANFVTYQFTFVACNAFGCGSESPSYGGGPSIPPQVQPVPSISNDKGGPYASPPTPGGKVVVGFNYVSGTGFAGTNFTTSCFGTQPNQAQRTLVMDTPSPITGPSSNKAQALRGDSAYCTVSANNRVAGTSFDATHSYADSFGLGGNSLDSGTIPDVYNSPQPPAAPGVTALGGGQVRVTLQLPSPWDSGGTDNTANYGFRAQCGSKTVESALGATQVTVSGLPTGTTNCLTYVYNKNFVVSVAGPNSSVTVT